MAPSLHNGVVMRQTEMGDISQMKGGGEMNITRIGLDLAKNVFQVHGVDANERVVLRRQLKRSEVLRFFAKLDRIETCIVGMEACCGSDYWARELTKLGYDARLMNPSFVKPYVKSNKNDARDAEAICEAVGRPTMRFVPVKTLEQQDLLLLHRQREQWIKRRTALVNHVRGLLGNYGIVIANRIGNLRQALPRLLEDAENDLTELARTVFAECYRELQTLDNEIVALDMRLSHIAETRTDCRRLMSIPGIGPMTATAFVAQMGDGRQFNQARQCAAYLGLVPAQYSSGGKEQLGGISKRGNRYLRTLLIHGARADIRAAKQRREKQVVLARDEWSCALEARRHQNVAVVALANKNARIAWALLRDETEYRAVA